MGQSTEPVGQFLFAVVFHTEIIMSLWQVDLILLFQACLSPLSCQLHVLHSLTLALILQVYIYSSIYKVACLDIYFLSHHGCGFTLSHALEEYGVWKCNYNNTSLLSSRIDITNHAMICSKELSQNSSVEKNLSEVCPPIDSFLYWLSFSFGSLTHL